MLPPDRLLAVVAEVAVVAVAALPEVFAALFGISPLTRAGN
jgi:hypothetical protein